MAKSISEFIQEQDTGILDNSMTLEQAYAEMSVATSLMTAYCECAAVMEFCSENSSTSYFGESAMDKLKAAGAKVGNFFKAIATFLKNLVRNIVNAIAADRIEKTIGIYKAKYAPDNMDTKLKVKTPDIERLLEDIDDFTEFLKEGIDEDKYTKSGDRKKGVSDGPMSNWEKFMPDYINDIKSEEGLAKRYGTKEQELTVSEFVDFLRKIKDSKANVKASKILKNLDKTIATRTDENGESKVSSDTVKSIKQLTNAFVKVYDTFYSTISKGVYTGAKDIKKDLDKDDKNEAQEFIKDERKREFATESFYLV